MGHSLSWLALEHADAALACERLGLEITSEHALPGEAPFVGGPMPGGWYLVVADVCEHTLVSDAVLRHASQDRAAVAAWMEEHVMACTAALWSFGERRWTLAHDPDRHGLADLRVEGQPPPELPAARAEAQAQLEAQRAQGGVRWDPFFEVPLRAAHGLAGFKHDEWPDGIEEVLVVHRLRPGGLLASPPAPAARRPWWRCW